MNKLSKIISVIVLMIVMTSMSMVVNAATNDDVISYVTMAHTVNGRTFQLDKTQRQSLTQYLKENPVTNSEADEIIAKLNEAKIKLEQTGATTVSQVSDSVRAEISSLVKSAVKIADLDIVFNTTKGTFSLKTLDGKKTIIKATSIFDLEIKNQNVGDSNNNAGSSNSNKTGDKLVYTGKDDSVAIKTIVAIVAVASIGLGVRKIYAK